jgi:hypothetical protein
VLIKLSMREGSGVPTYRLRVGFTVLCAGLLATAVGEPSRLKVSRHHRIADMPAASTQGGHPPRRRFGTIGRP